MIEVVNSFLGLAASLALIAMGAVILTESERIARLAKDMVTRGSAPSRLMPMRRRVLRREYIFEIRAIGTITLVLGICLGVLLTLGLLTRT